MKVIYADQMWSGKSRGKQEIDCSCYIFSIGEVRWEYVQWRSTGDSQGRLWLIFTHDWAADFSILSSLPATAHSDRRHVRLHNASALRQDVLFLMSIFHSTDIKQISRLERNNVSTTAGDKFSLHVVNYCGGRSGYSAFKRLACVIRGLWSGKGPECHDVYAELWISTPSHH